MVVEVGSTVSFSDVFSGGVIAVAATRRDGRATSYSNWGASILVAAPGGEVRDGLFTTDVMGDGGFNMDTDSLGDGDYISNEVGFIGTSAAAPLISGLSGLVLSVNPEFSVRDVQQIVLASARHVFLDDPDMAGNGAGFKHSHHVGFGIPDAGEAAIFCGAIVGSCLGFLWYNAPPAKIFMGDTGSLSLGGSLGAVGIVTKHEIVLVKELVKLLLTSMLTVTAHIITTQIKILFCP